MLLRRHPEMAIAPPAQVAELLDLRMRLLHIVFHRQAGGIVDANIAAQTPKDAADLVGEQF